MHLNFLCPRHKRQLSDAPLLAAKFWFQCDEQLRSLQGAATPQKVNLAGSALEAAGIFLNSVSQVEREAIGKYATTAVSLIRFLIELEQTRLALVVVTGTNALLEQLTRKGADERVVEQACRAITAEADLVPVVSLLASGYKRANVVPFASAATA